MQPWRSFKPDGVILISDILTPHTGQPPRAMYQPSVLLCSMFAAVAQLQAGWCDPVQ